MRMTPLKRRRLAAIPLRTQAEVAAALGINPRYYTEIENGTKRPGMKTALRIAQYWGCSVDEVICAWKLEESSRHGDEKVENESSR